MGSICCQFNKKGCPLIIKAGISQQQTSNLIQTTKYNILTFLPLATLIQFKRLANVYFLITAILQFIPIISPLSPFSAITPLIFVLAVSLIRTGIEQIGKYKFDRKANSAQFQIQEQSMSYNWAIKRSDQLKVGDIIKINQDQRIPADAILLHTTNIDSKAYIQTSSLDGEKNLKPRSVLPLTQKLYSTLNKLSSCNENQFDKPLLTIQQPSEQLYNFNGQIQCKNWSNSQKIQKQFLKTNQFLYRDSVLRNTQAVIAVIIYTGQYTKIMLNSGDRSEKMSKLQKQVNFYMIFIFLFQLLLVIACGILRVFLYYRTQQGQKFITQFQQQSIRSYIAQGGITMGSYFILLNTMIPISLLVSIQIVKFGQGYLIQCDSLMKNSKQAVINAFRSSINEQLGMIEYIFTDKTGTLTKNQMFLKEIMADGKQFSHQAVQSNQKYFNNAQVTNLLWDNLDFIQALDDSQYQNKIKSQKQAIMINLLIFAMSVCHQCILSQGTNQYQGPSPDQITLVASAANLGTIFKNNSLSVLNIQLKNRKSVEIKLLQLFEFNSDRKRMSVIVQYCSPKTEKTYRILLCKGADSMINTLLRPYNNYNRQQTDKFITQLSKKGLRTLLFGYKLVSDEQYKSFKHSFMQLDQKQQKQKQILIKNLQSNLMLIGATGVEDKLQQKVGQTISDFIRANIKVAMLTGDKMQTAQNIATTCGLFKPELQILKIQYEQAQQELFRGYCRLQQDGQFKEYGMLVEGEAINKILDSLYFIELFKNCKAAVFCRITPKNKAEMVEFAKINLKKLTLAIGDGANDVPMIMAANIGIGLYGNEGMNAVQASDFALPQFKALWRLIFVHGRWNYIRIADLIKYFFYKNIVYTLGQLWFGWFCSFSGQTIYEATYLVLYNTIFTGGPVLVRALLQQDINYMQIVNSQKQQKISELKQSLIPLREIGKQTHKDIIIRQPISIQNNDPNKNQYPFPSNIRLNPYLQYLFPKLYEYSQKHKSLTPGIFFFVMLQATISSILIFLVLYYSLQPSQYTVYSIVLYSTILALVTVRIIYQITYWNTFLVLTILLTSIVPYILFVYIMDLFEQSLRGTFVEIFTQPDFYLTLILAASLAVIVMGIFGVFRKYYDPSEVQIVRKQAKDMLNRNKKSNKQAQYIDQGIYK